MFTSGISVNAPAKVNLYLHVVGKRPDGYHLLDSLFAFARDGDVVTVYPADRLSLEITGAYASALDGGTDNNIVIKAALKLAETLGIEPKARIILEKNLPVASGIGGGSSDAAAALRALLALWEGKISEEKLYALGLSLGADVPSCLAGKTVQVSGIGDVLIPAHEHPVLPAVLVNPNKPVSTPAVFKARQGGFSPPMPVEADFSDIPAFVEALKLRRNDLAQAACALEPSVSAVLETLESFPGCLLARMSGSGGTCFGLFRTWEEAVSCRERLAAEHSGWWVKETGIL